MDFFFLALSAWKITRVLSIKEELLDLLILVGVEEDDGMTRPLTRNSSKLPNATQRVTHSHCLFKASSSANGTMILGNGHGYSWPSMPNTNIN